MAASCRRPRPTRRCHAQSWSWSPSPSPPRLEGVGGPRRSADASTVRPDVDPEFLHAGFSDALASLG
eukprot:2607664-Pyramimonas_sp.AAC.1